MDMSTPVPSAARVLLGALIGAVVGLAFGAVAYLVVDAVLEGRGGWIEEFQGFAWNLVPLSAMVGAGLGVLVARRH